MNLLPYAHKLTEDERDWLRWAMVHNVSNDDARIRYDCFTILFADRDKVLTQLKVIYSNSASISFLTLLEKLDPDWVKHHTLNNTLMVECRKIASEEYGKARRNQE